MKTFRLSTVERVIWFQVGNASHLLVKARGRGWFIDSRGWQSKKPPSKGAVLRCLTNPIESSFKPFRAKEWKF